MMRYLDKYMDWIMDSRSGFSFFGKMIFTFIAPITLAVVTPIYYFSSKNARALENTFEELDSQNTLVFENIDDCTSTAGKSQKR